MKKINCMVFYNQNNSGYYLNNITIKCRNGATIELYNIENDKIDKNHKHIYSFHNMYTDVLNFLKSNNFYVNKYTIFNALYYDIDFINLDNDKIIIEHYSYKSIDK